MAKRYDDERWFPIVKLGGRYEVSSCGRIKSIQRKAVTGNGGYRYVKEIIRKLQTNGGYWFLMIKNPPGDPVGIYVHIEMAIAFIPNPENKPEINHKDGNPANNSLDNLEWCTRSENMLHTYMVLNHKRAKRVVYKGEEKLLVNLCRDHKIAPSVVKERIKAGWGIEEALATPKNKYTQYEKV